MGWYSDLKVIQCSDCIKKLKELGFNVRFNEETNRYVVYNQDRAKDIPECTEQLTDDDELNSLATGVIGTKRFEEIVRYLNPNLELSNNNTNNTEEDLSDSKLFRQLFGGTIKTFSCREIIAVLNKFGYKLQRISGSHYVLSDGKNATVSVACHGKDDEKSRNVVKKICDTMHISLADFAKVYNNLFGTSKAIASQDNKEIKLSQFGAGYGEHWIDEDGNLMYADGDVGSMNHEMHVIQRAQGMIAGDRYTDSEFVNWDGFLESVAQEIVNKAKTNTRLRKKIESELGDADIYTVRLEYVVGYGFVEDELLRRKVNKDLLNIANGHGDARLFGMKMWGWKRVMNNYIETFNLTPRDAQLISKGIGEIVPDDEEGKTKWNLEVISTKKYYTNIPLFVIDKGPIAISKFRQDSVMPMSEPNTLASSLISKITKG